MGGFSKLKNYSANSMNGVPRKCGGGSVINVAHNEGYRNGNRRGLQSGNTERPLDLWEAYYCDRSAYDVQMIFI